MPCSMALTPGTKLPDKRFGLPMFALGLCCISFALAQGPQNPPRPPQAFPGNDQIQYLPQGIVAVANLSPSTPGYRSGSSSPNAGSSPSSPSASGPASPSSAAGGPSSPGPGAAGGGSPSAGAGTSPPASAAAAPEPAAAPPTPPPEATPGVPDGTATAGSPTAAAALALSPVLAPAPGPLAPLVAPAQLPQPTQSPSGQNAQATTVDGMLQLQGQNLWPFTNQAQAALTSALAAAMPAVPQDQIRILETFQATSPGTRRLQQAPSLVNAHFQAQATDASRAASAREQLESAAAAGSLAAGMRSNAVTVDSVRLLLADLTSPTVQSQPASGAINVAALAGGVAAGVLVLAAAVAASVCCSLRWRNARTEGEVQQEPEYRADPFYCGSVKSAAPEEAKHKTEAGGPPQPEQVIAMTDPAHAAVMGLSSATGESAQATPFRSRAATPSFVSHSRNSSAISAQVQATIDQLRSHADELSRPATPAVAGAQDAGAAKPLVLTPSANMDMHGRIAAANSQLNAFTASLTAESAAPTVAALLAAKAADRKKLAVAGATGSKVMKLNIAMQYLTDNSRFADKYELESARIAGDSCIVASAKQLSSGCAVVLKFYVDEEDFLHLKRFHHQARDPQYIPGVLDIFEAGEVALGSVGSPTCIVCETGQYSLAHYMARMERNPSAARQKSTLTQLLEAISYLHGRSMVHREIQPDSCVWCDSVSRWRLAGSQTWARKGTDAALSYKLRYAAPEVVMADSLGMATRLKMGSHPASSPAEGQAQEDQSSSASSAGTSSSPAVLTQGPVLHVTQAASDMWAVGALAWELLTGRPLFGDSFSDEDVVMALLGFKPLPFEADPSLWVLFTESQAAVLLQGLLARRPEQRLTVSKALHIMASLGDGN